MNNRWLDFIKEAQILLLQGQNVNNHKTVIQLAIQHSIYNSVFLQFEITKEVKWYRTSWLMLDDAQKFHDPIESLKYIGLKVRPTITYENGVIEKENIQKILHHINKLSLKPQLEQQTGFTLDGIFYILILGDETSQITLKWQTLPEEWADLSDLICLLEELNKKLK